MYVFTLGADADSTTATRTLSKTTTALSRALSAASVQAASFHDYLFPPNEKTMTLRIKALIARGNAAEAEAILDTLPQKQQQRQHGKKNDHDQYQRLRTFAPIFAHYCGTAQIVPMLKLFRKMRQSKGVLLDTETYALMIQTLALQNCFANHGIFQNSEHSRIAENNSENATAAPSFDLGHQHEDHGATTMIAGFTVSNGPILFNEIAHEMAQDVLELPESCAQMIHDAFVKGFSRRDYEKLAGTAVPPARRIIHCSAEGEDEGGNVLIGRVPIDEATVMCPATHAKLRLFSLTTSQREEMRETLLDMAKTRHEEYSEKLKSRTKNRDNGGDKNKNNNDDVVEAGEYAFQQLLAFSEWLSKGRLGESTDDENDDAPYTAIVDGPNIAYYGHGDVHYSQVQCVVEELERLGEKVLVVMPFKYVASNFYLSSLNKMQTLTERDHEPFDCDETFVSRPSQVPRRLLLDDGQCH
jgi:hypothetical protein